MRIGVVSDTHSQGLPGAMLRDFQGVDLIIHAGDFCDVRVYEALARIAKVEGVFGNMDNAAIRQVFPRRKIIQCGPVSIGVYHGEGSPKMTLENVREEFAGEKLDIVIFGHTHQPFHQKEGAVLYFNPGSPNDHIFAPYCSYGMIEINEKGFKVKHIKVKE